MAEPARRRKHELVVLRPTRMLIPRPGPPLTLLFLDHEPQTLARLVGAPARPDVLRRRVDVVGRMHGADTTRYAPARPAAAP